MQGGPSVAVRNKGGSSPVSAELFHHHLAVHEEREAAAAEAEAPTAEQAQQPEPRKAQETPAAQPQEPTEPIEEPKDDTETKRRALLDALAADLAHALEELRDIARDKERDLRAQNLAPEALDAALKELRERLEEAENEAKQAHEKAVQRALKVEFAEDDDPDGVRQYLAQALASIVGHLRSGLLGMLLQKPLLTKEEIDDAIRAGAEEIPLATPEAEAAYMSGKTGEQKNPPTGKQCSSDVAKRHYWKNVFKIEKKKNGKKTLTSALIRGDNTVVLPGTPCRRDLQDINDGRAIAITIQKTKIVNGVSRIEEKECFLINGRVYDIHPTKRADGTISRTTVTPFPIEGVGLVFLNRLEYKALAVIVGSEAFRGRFDIDLINADMRQNKIPKDAAVKAWRVWGAIQKGLKNVRR